VPNIVEKYNQAERAGRATVSNRAIESFSLEVFNAIGYPCRIEDESELWRYHDVMNEGNFQAYLPLIANFSENEFELITKTAGQILSFSERHLPIRNSGKHALMRSLHQYRLLMKNRPNDDPLRIFEIGPGSGYLGLLLANDGHQYFAMDAAQAFYLYQKKLWSDTYGSDYFDYSESSSRPDTAKITHIPWWQFANLSIPVPDVDIVTINHALTEMHPQAVKTIFTRLYSAWGDTEKKLVLAEGTGYDYFRRKQAMFADIQSAGFFGGEHRDGCRIWKPNRKESIIELLKSSEKQTFKTRTSKKMLKRKDKLIAKLLRSQIGQQLAKLISRGPIHQNKIDSASTAKAIVQTQTQTLHDFFENLVADERTQDEVFLKPRTGDIK